jgi:hypothetical protein
MDEHTHKWEDLLINNKPSSSIIDILVYNSHGFLFSGDDPPDILCVSSIIIIILAVLCTRVRLLSNQISTILKPSIELEFEQRNSVGEEKFSGLKFMGRDVFKSVLLHYSLSIFALAHISFLYSLFLRDRSWVRFSVVVLSAVLFSGWVGDVEGLYC